MQYAFSSLDTQQYNLCPEITVCDENGIYKCFIKFFSTLCLYLNHEPGSFERDLQFIAFNNIRRFKLAHEH